MFGFKRKKQEFFNHFEASAAIIKQSIDVLSNLMDDYASLPQRLHELDELETKGDKITRVILDHVNKTFATPIAREDIFNIAHSLDDITDGLNNVCEKMLLYKAGSPTQSMIEMVQLLEKIADHIEQAFSLLHHINHNQDKIISLCRKINYLESKGDSIYKEGVAQLFDKNTDPIELIKQKELYADIEDVVDLCEDVADLLKGVVLKYA